MNSNLETLDLKKENNNANIDKSEVNDDEDYSDMPPLIDEEYNNFLKDVKTENVDENVNEDSERDSDDEDSYYVLSTDGLNIKCSESKNIINECLDILIRRDVLKYSYMGNIYVSTVRNETHVTLQCRNLLFWTTERLLHTYRVDKLKK